MSYDDVVLFYLEYKRYKDNLYL